MFIYLYYNTDEYINEVFGFNPQLTRVVKTRSVQITC